MKKILFAIIPFVLLTIFSSEIFAYDYRSLRDDEMAKYKDALIVYRSLKKSKGISQERLSETAKSVMVYKLNALYYYSQNLKTVVGKSDFPEDEKTLLTEIVAAFGDDIKKLQEKAKKIITLSEAISLSVELKDKGNQNMNIVRLYMVFDNQRRAEKIANNMERAIKTASQADKNLEFNSALKLLENAREKYKKASEILNLKTGLTESRFYASIDEMYNLLDEGNVLIEEAIRKVKGVSDI